MNSCLHSYFATSSNLNVCVIHARGTKSTSEYFYKWRWEAFADGTSTYSQLFNIVNDVDK